MTLPRPDWRTWAAAVIAAWLLMVVALAITVALILGIAGSID